MQCYAVNTKILHFNDFFFQKKVERDFQKWTFLKMSKSEICKIVFSVVLKNGFIVSIAVKRGNIFLGGAGKKIFGHF